MARPDGRQIWVNFAFPDNEWVQVIDTVEKVVHTFSPGKACCTWNSPRAARKSGFPPGTQPGHGLDTATFAVRRELPVDAPSGIFFTTRAASASGSDMQIMDTSLE
jgi:protein NirF